MFLRQSFCLNLATSLNTVESQLRRAQKVQTRDTDFWPQSSFVCPFKLPERVFAQSLASHFSCSKLWAYTELYHNVSLMAKFIFSMGNENYRKLQIEAKTRDVTIQALIRTVVIPEWIKTHIETTTTNSHASVTETSSLLGHTTGFLGQHRSLPSSVGRRT
jgi:hypothetical protein